MKSKYFFLSLILFITSFVQIKASHIRAGDIQVSKVDTGNPSSRLYRITVTLYRDVVGVSAQAGEIDFGDDSEPQIVEPISLGLTDNAQTEVLEYVVEHNFPVFSTYKISYFERNRNGGILNMSNSLEVPFYISAEVSMSPSLGLNSSDCYTLLCCLN